MVGVSLNRESEWNCKITPRKTVFKKVNSSDAYGFAQKVRGIQPVFVDDLTGELDRQLTQSSHFSTLLETYSSAGLLRPGCFSMNLILT